MKTNAHYFRIGLFVITALILLIAGLIVTSSNLFKGDRILIETYLNESVQGLSIGTPLLHRGVAIGRIEKITFVHQEYHDQIRFGTPEYDEFSKYVMVVMSVNKDHFVYIGSENSIGAVIRNQINNGLRLKLSYQGITGIAYMEADYLTKEQNSPLTVPWKPANIYIPSTPSLITNFTQAVETVFQRLAQIDFPDIFQQLQDTLKSIQQGVDEAKLGEIRQSAVELLDQLNRTTKQAEALMKTSNPDMPTVSIADTIAQLDRNLKQIERLVTVHQDDVDAVLLDLKTLTRNLKLLSEQIKVDPAQLLFSAPPQKTEIEK